MNLFYKSLGAGKPIIILHGLFGSGENWLTIGKELADDGSTVYLLDARNHGSSPHADEHNYSVMVEDLHTFITQHELDKPVIIGHSMGGKTAMAFANKYPSMLHKLAVVDISPRAYPPHHQLYINAMLSLPLDKIDSRVLIDAHFSNQGITNLSERQFLMKNIGRKEDNTFYWKINLPVLAAQIDNIGESTLPKKYLFTNTLFIKGGNSDFYINESDKILIRFHYCNVQIITIEGAGHWVQAEKPVEFLQIMREFIDG